MVEDRFIWRVVCEELCVKNCAFDKVVCDKVVCVWKVVCETFVCETLSVTNLCVKKLCMTKLFVTKLCVKDCVCDKFVTSCVKDCVCEQVVCETFVCETLSVTKLCVKKLCMTKMCVREKLHVREMCVKELWCVCVTKLCVREMCEKVVCERAVSDKVVRDKMDVRERCERLCGAKFVWQSRIWERWTHLQGGCHQVPRLPRQTKVNVAKRHACHANRTSMSPSATPATQSAAASRATNGDQARHQTQPRVWKLWQVLGAQFFETIVLMKFVLKNPCQTAAHF